MVTRGGPNPWNAAFRLRVRVASRHPMDAGALHKPPGEEACATNPGQKAPHLSTYNKLFTAIPKTLSGP
jgi:hypothetical protein